MAAMGWVGGALSVPPVSAPPAPVPPTEFAIPPSSTLGRRVTEDERTADAHPTTAALTTEDEERRVTATRTLLLHWPAILADTLVERRVHRLRTMRRTLIFRTLTARLNSPVISTAHTWHESWLRRLWAAAHLGELEWVTGLGTQLTGGVAISSEFNAVSPRWQWIGSVDVDCAPLYRIGGFLALENATRFAERYASYLQSVLRRLIAARRTHSRVRVFTEETGADDSDGEEDEQSTRAAEDEDAVVLDERDSDPIRVQPKAARPATATRSSRRVSLGTPPTPIHAEGSGRPSPARSLDPLQRSQRRRFIRAIRSRQMRETGLLAEPESFLTSLLRFVSPRLTPVAGTTSDTMDFVDLGASASEATRPRRATLSGTALVPNTASATTSPPTAAEAIRSPRWYPWLASTSLITHAIAVRLRLIPRARWLRLANVAFGTPRAVDAESTLPIRSATCTEPTAGAAPHSGSESSVATIPVRAHVADHPTPAATTLSAWDPLTGAHARRGVAPLVTSELSDAPRLELRSPTLPPVLVPSPANRSDGACAFRLDATETSAPFLSSGRPPRAEYNPIDVARGSPTCWAAVGGLRVAGDGRPRPRLASRGSGETESDRPRPASRKRTVRDSTELADNPTGHVFQNVFDLAVVLLDTLWAQVGPSKFSWERLVEFVEMAVEEAFLWLFMPVPDPTIPRCRQNTDAPLPALDLAEEWSRGQTIAGPSALAAAFDTTTPGGAGGGSIARRRESGTPSVTTASEMAERWAGGDEDDGDDGGESGRGTLAGPDVETVQVMSRGGKETEKDVRKGALQPSLLDQAPGLANSLWGQLPDALRGRRWRRVYSLLEDGAALPTMFARASEHEATFILMDVCPATARRRRVILGGMTTAPWTAHVGYFGRGASFVFRWDATGTPAGSSLAAEGGGRNGAPIDEDKDPRFAVFGWTGRNSSFQWAHPDGIAMGGGGGGFAWYLDGSMSRGSSAASYTYGNPSLLHLGDPTSDSDDSDGGHASSASDSHDFLCRQVEVWALCRRGS